MANLWTLVQVFRRSARQHADRTRLAASGSRLTCAQADARSSASAAAMSELGTGAGDRLTTIPPNRPERTVALLACARFGTIDVPVNPRLNYHELRYQLRHAAADTAATAEQYDGVDFLRHFEDAIAELPDLRYLVTVRGRGATVRRPDLRARRSDVAWGRASIPEPSSAGDGSNVALLYTSGTTMGKPNGVRLWHRVVVETVVLTGAAIAAGPAGRVGCAAAGRDLRFRRRGWRPRGRCHARVRRGSMLATHCG